MLSIIKPFRSFSSHEGGASAVEFALVLPFIVSLMMGGYELTQAINADRKISLSARTVADITAQTNNAAPLDPTNITTAEMTNQILKAGATVMAPHDTTKVQIVVSSVRVDANGNARIAWSETTPNAVASKRSVNSTAPIDDNLKIRGTTLIWAEVTYPYTPLFGSAITGTINLKESLLMRPRSQDCLKYNNVGCT